MRKAIQFLGILSDVDVDWMATHGMSVSVPDGTVLIQEGVKIDYIYFLFEGELEVFLAKTGARIATLLPGEILGEISFVDSRPPIASVRTHGECTLLELPRPLIRSRLEEDTAFAARFYRAIAAFLADRLHVTVGRFGYGSAAQDVDVDEIDDDAMDVVSLGLVQMDNLLRRVRSGSSPGAA